MISLSFTMTSAGSARVVCLARASSSLLPSLATCHALPATCLQLQRSLHFMMVFRVCVTFHGPRRQATVPTSANCLLPFGFRRLALAAWLACQSIVASATRCCPGLRHYGIIPSESPATRIIGGPNNLRIRSPALAMLTSASSINIACRTPWVAVDSSLP